MTSEQIRAHLSRAGKKGGEAGSGDAKRRPKAHYQLMARKSAEKRKKEKL